MSHRLPLDACPFCGHPLDATDDPSDPDRQAAEGDGSICIDCGALAVFGPGLKLRRPTQAELVAFAENSDLIPMLLALDASRHWPRG